MNLLNVFSCWLPVATPEEQIRFLVQEEIGTDVISTWRASAVCASNLFSQFLLFCFHIFSKTPGSRSTLRF